jgi:hypothetical protein
VHVIVATDGSQASLAGARQFKWIADSREITDVTIIAVVSPYAAVPFANELGPQRRPGMTELNFNEEAKVGPGDSPGNPQRFARARDHSCRRRPGCGSHFHGVWQPRSQPHHPARQHRLPGAALGALPGTGVPPNPAQRTRPRRVSVIKMARTSLLVLAISS